MTLDPNGRWGRGTFRCAAVAAAALLLTGSLAACGPADSGLGQDTARQFQQRVLEISQAAAGNDPAGALSALETLEAEVATAAGNGTVSENRRRSITTAAAAVRADLTAAKESADAAAAKAAEDAAAAKKQAAADAAAAEAQNAAPAPAPAEDKGNDTKGKGKGKDD
ncbi:hypothetical protein [Pseudarthrobacter sulfonivorans]|uniref:hypothetical protein n=1 Tax=Pseudarthrobacter sulfonivorans TaxID=121292 RepID=UPI0028621328|nr:hypothetical protein [Pseudarthrobacter sulfonivorans]MDR6415463.1 DNA-binding GntR family transcriptional regulator [Pseudarthrobacter sulfonivorans]